MGKNKNPRQQASKPAKSGNTEYMRGMQDIRFGNAAGAHKSAKAYQRKPKHFKGWD